MISPEPNISVQLFQELPVHSLAAREGLEPTTLGLTGPCSNRLSYLAKSIHLIWEDGMRNPLDRPPGEGSTMFKSRRLSESNHSLWSSCLCDRAKVYRETVCFASYWQ